MVYTTSTAGNGKNGHTTSIINNEGSGNTDNNERGGQFTTNRSTSTMSRMNEMGKVKILKLIRYQTVN